MLADLPIRIYPSSVSQNSALNPRLFGNQRNRGSFSRSVPIVIGIFEATSIDRRVKGLPSPRPLTHDLVTSVIENMGGDLQDIYISELRDHTYYAKLRIRHDGELVEVDSRPSDAIALAVAAKVPIYVAEDVLEEVCGEEENEEE